MKNLTRIAFLVLVVLLNIQIGISSGNESIRFKQSVITIPTTMYGGFLVDRDGFVWISATGLGVYRYDGYELKRFSSSILGTMISSIVEDKDGMIWMASFSNGITCYDKETGLFTGYKHDPDNRNSLSSNNISFSPHKLCIDKSNRLWVGTDDAGLCEYIKSTDTWTHYVHNPDDSNSLSDNAVMAIAEGRDGTLWVGTQSGGLNKYDRETGTWTCFRHDPADQNSLSDNWINSILEDRDGVLWVGTKSGGLNRFDRNEGVFSHYIYDQNDPLSIGSNDIWSIYEDHSGGIWTSHMASPSSGLDRFDKNRGAFTRYGHDPNDPSSVSSNSILNVYEDFHTETLWVVNYNGSIDKSEKSSMRFRNWTADLDKPNRLSDRSILPIIEGSDDRVWVGTMSGGLNSIDRETGKIEHYRHDPHEQNSIPRDRVTALCEGSSGVLWVGFWDGILAGFDRENGECIRIYEHDPGDLDSITKSERLKYILEDRDDPDILWLATIKGGLDRFDKRRELFVHYKKSDDERNSISHSSIVTVYDDGKGLLWVPTYGGGLDKFDKKTKTFTNYRHEDGNSESLGSDTLYEVLETADGALWISRKGGISRFDRESGNFKNYNEDENGVPYGSVGSMLQDDEGNLWLGTVGGGLIRFDPASGATKRITVDDGHNVNTNFWTSRLKTRDGELWFGGNNGINSFYPSGIVENTYVPSIVLTAITQGGVTVDTGTSPERLKKLILDWRSNYFEFQFAALNYTTPEKNQYSYMLEGWDEEWYYSGSKPFGRYSGLTGGEYTLKLKGSNNSGVWNEEGISITVIVTPPFWQTLWFYCLMALLCSGIIFSVVFYIGKLRSEITERKQGEVEIRKLSQAIEHSSATIVITDAKGNIEYVNPKFTQLTGYSFEEAIGKNPRILKSGKTPPEVFKELWNTIISGNEWKGRFSNKKKNGELYWEYASISPVKDTKGIITNFIAVKDDVTERNMMEETLLQSEKLKSLGTITAGIAHDFNNILAIISGCTQLLELENEGNDGFLKMLHTMSKASDDGAEIVRRMRMFTKQEKGDSVLLPVDINGVLKESIEFVKPRWMNIAKAGGIYYDIDYHDGITAAVTIAGNESELREVFINIMNNAMDAMEKGGGLAFRTWQDEENVFISISDTGEGMPEEVRAHVFEPFYTTKREKGSGLGLSMSYGIIERHGGDIEVKSKKGKGTTFIIRLPVNVPPEHKTELSAEDPKIKAKDLRILVIDDQEALRSLLELFFTKNGHTVRAVESGNMAVEVFKTESFDLVLCDLVMPGMSGHQVVEVLNRLEKRPKIGVMTGWSEKIRTNDDHELDVDFVIMKPIKFQVLAGLINKALSVDSRGE